MKLRAWIEHKDGMVVAAFVAVGAACREPATRFFRGESEAIRWIRAEAEVIDAPIEWA
jgi:hypothetical protein